MGLPAMSAARKEPDLNTYSGQVSARIRELRDKAGISVQDVVSRMDAMGFSTTIANFRHWENGTVKPNLDAIPFLAEIFNVKKSKFFPD